MVHVGMAMCVIMTMIVRMRVAVTPVTAMPVTIVLVITVLVITVLVVMPIMGVCVIVRHSA